MTLNEKRDLETFREICERFAAGYHVRRIDYQLVMGHIRDRIRALEAVESGCATGKHTGYCTCKPAIEGHHITQGG